METLRNIFSQLLLLAGILPREGGRCPRAWDTQHLCVPSLPLARLTPQRRDGHPLAGKAAPAQFAQVDVGPLQISLYPRAEVRTNSKRPSAPASLSRLHERNSNISLP